MPITTSGNNIGLPRVDVSMEETAKLMSKLEKEGKTNSKLYISLRDTMAIFKRRSRKEKWSK